jgi:valyl-tRNA synthetase
MSSRETTDKKLTQKPEHCQSATFDPVAIERSWYQWWEENGFFRAEVNAEREPYTIVIPPPNVTGALHLGHALNNTLQDVLIRQARMDGYEALWLPGTDHAGIATQAVVERLLWQQEQKTRHDLGREAMIERIWQWKEVYEKRILGQLKRLASSLDWQRTQFTMSPELSRAVRYVFQCLFREGLIYRGQRLINWSPGIQTALSNDELVYKTVDSHFWYVRYPIEGREAEYIEVATTRPETMLGDTAVAVHPDPEAELQCRLAQANLQGDTEAIERLERRLREDLPRLKAFAGMIGEQAILPLLNRPIPVIGDPILADPEKGTGAVKVTPAHDPNDYACGLRNALPMINILNPDGTLNEAAGPYQGLLGIAEGRNKVVADLREGDYLIRVEPLQHEVAHCYRTGVPVEPYLSDQWFVKMEPLVQLAKQCYLDGQVKFHPAHRGKDYMRWLESTPDWCISRQLWWGHRIPIWYCLDCYPAIEIDREGEPIGRSIPSDALPIVASADNPYETPAACPKCKGSRLVQDPDVLDTWFSSQLWPLSTLGWPEETADLNYFYPTHVLVTGRDIIALWVARMVMMGMKFRNKTPYYHVLINGTVQDEHGDIMSKSRGNGFDPVRVIDGGSDNIYGSQNLGDIPAHRTEHYAIYGTDAIRYGLTSLTTGNTQDIRLTVNREPLDAPSDSELPAYRVSIPRFEEGRRFCNKIWQASRGVVFRQCQNYTHDPRIEALEDQWLYHRLHLGIQTIEQAVAEFDLGSVCDELYRLFWDDFCSWYLEVIKPRLWGNEGEQSRAQAQTHLIHALDTLLRLLHPIVPIITESLWQELQDLRLQAGQPADPSPALIKAQWPALADYPTNDKAYEQERLVRQITAAINQMRSQQPGISDKTQLPKLIVTTQNPSLLAELQVHLNAIRRFLRIDQIEALANYPQPGICATAVVGECQLFLPLEGLIDIDAELERLTKQLKTSQRDIERWQAQLNNPKFVDRAPAQIVQQTQDRLSQETLAISTLQQQIQSLQSMGK